MKKAAISAIAAAMLLTAAVPGAAFAQNDKHPWKQDGEKKTGLENALEHVKNERARAAIEANIERKKNHNGDEEDGDGQEHTAAYIVARDKAALAIDFGGADTAGSVTQPLDALPSVGANGSTITWASSNPAVISADGKTVVRPAAGSSDATVTLTATITYGNVSATKTFELTVKALWTDAQRVALDKEALAIDFGGADAAGSVTQPLDTLPTQGAYGSAITWASSSPAVISADGKTVVRPAAGSGDATVTLTAYIAYNGTVDTKAFTLVVKQQLTAAQKVAADKEALAIGYTATDSAVSVTGPVTLPKTGANGSAIVWVSSQPAVISTEGAVVRPADGTGDKAVMLTAVIVNEGVSDTKTFVLTVKEW
ncbi:immunoglobulin-like domain-containing protein [Paenibacillus hamazuiensis]|uniref:immunoglobulin-like domain-containing protein n=1 Tax=Paenibacillus hamazuiensis TaxID=2936508 RepID=UPI00200C5C86|nr:immunoglobulin-like domain-containing protein [Paenibacillus hamazuiensis]